MSMNLIIVDQFLVLPDNMRQDQHGKHFEQPVRITKDAGGWEERTYVNQSDSTEWTDINGTLEIEKVDTDNYNKKLSGVTFDISGLGQHTTDANGRIYLENIRPGTYSVREISNTNYGYLAVSSDIININTVSDNIGVTTGQYRTPIEKNIKVTGNLVIEKTSKESGKPLEDFSFKLRDSKGRYIIAKTGEKKEKRDKVKEYILLTDIETTNDINQATEFITDSKGHIEIYNLLIDTYTIMEVSVGADKREENRYFDVDDNYITWSSNVNDNKWSNSVNNNGTKNLPKVKITRQKSQDTEKIGGPADKISIKNERKYIDIKGLVWEDLPDGKKTIRNFVYNTKTQDTDDTKDRLLGNVTVNLKSIDQNGNVEIVKNIKANTKDGVKDVDGTIDTGIEGSGDEYYGKYEFRNVLIRDLDKYYIEFVYNGLSYKAIDLANGSYQELKNGYLAEATLNTSKAIEENVWQTKFENNSRTFFNNKYQVIENNKAKGDVGELEMSYDFANRVSTLNFEGNPKYGYSGARFPINYTKDQYLMSPNNKSEGKETTNTRKAYNGGLDQIKSKQEIREKDIKVINNVNLGLYEREQPDLGINGKYNVETNQAEYGKQLDNVKIKINGYNHIYKYESRYLNAGDYQGGFNVGVKFENRRGAQPYTRAIYKADVEFESADKNRELEVYLTYKIILNNNSANLKAQINEIVDYYDSRYIKEEIKVGTQLSDVADPTNPDPNKEIKITEFGTSVNGYNKIVIDTSKLGYIEKQSACKDYVYVQFKLNKEAVVEILCDGDIKNIRNGIEAPENKLLKNIVEIKSYSIQDQTGAVYAGIDQNSNPENCKPGDDTTYEDDTDYSPAVKLAVAKNNRTINGLAYEDKENLNNNIRQGNGSYNTSEGDRPLKGVVVQLQRRDYDDMGKWKTIKETGAEGTKADGTFQFEDFAAGDYQLTYKWDNSNDNKHGTSAIHPNILVQNYKATIFDENAHKLNATTYGNEERAEKYYWYREGNRLSDAKDNYETRKQIDSEISTFRYNTENEVNRSGTNSMTSATPEIPIGVEYADVISTSVFGDEYKYDVTNIDFGIVERPLQNYKLTKNIDHIKVTLPNGQVLVDADVIVEPAGIGRDGRMTYSMKLEGVTNFLKPLPRMGSRFLTGKSNEAGYPNGSIELEIDNEIVQGSTLEITYKINIENTSELDYNNQDFYEHGTNATTDYKKDVIRITPSKVIDYLDKEWAVDETIQTNSETWKKKSQEALQAGRDSDDEFPVSPDVYTKEGSELRDRIILYSDKLSKDGISLVPNDPTSRTGTQDNSLKEYGQGGKEDKRLTLVATKVLTTIDSSDVVLANETEIIEIQRPGGGVPEENIEGKTLVEGKETKPNINERKRIIPGNFVPGSGWQIEPDDDKSETFFMTPNTGEDLNYALPISIGVGALVILALGIIMIIKLLRMGKKTTE